MNVREVHSFPVTGYGTVLNLGRPLSDRDGVADSAVVLGLLCVMTRTLVAILERKVGRIIANGFPTGVEVADPKVHSGPYPASTNFGASSVGSLSIRRFLRPVCYQDIPVDLLAEDTRPE